MGPVGAARSGAVGADAPPGRILALQRRRRRAMVRARGGRPAFSLCLCLKLKIVCILKGVLVFVQQH